MFFRINYYCCCFFYSTNNNNTIDDGLLPPQSQSNVGGDDGSNISSNNAINHPGSLQITDSSNNINDPTAITVPKKIIYMGDWV